MNGTSTSKVKRRQIEQPTIGVPSPASDGAVYDSRPAEGKDERRQDTSTFEASTCDEHHSTSTEQHLVETEDYFGEKN